MSDKFSRIIGRVLYYLLKPIAVLRVICRKAARRVLLATNDDWVFYRYRNALRYKIVRRKRKPFHISDGVLWWEGRQIAVTFHIPEEVSQEQAQILCHAQTIDPWFADQLFNTYRRMADE